MFGLFQWYDGSLNQQRSALRPGWRMTRSTHSKGTLRSDHSPEVTGSPEQVRPTFLQQPHGGHIRNLHRVQPPPATEEVDVRHACQSVPPSPAPSLRALSNSALSCGSKHEHKVSPHSSCRRKVLFRGPVLPDGPGVLEGVLEGFGSIEGVLGSSGASCWRREHL